MTRTSRIVLAAAAILAVAALAGPAPRADDALTRTFPFSPGSRLEIDTDRGHIDVRTGSSDLRVTVRAKRGMVSDYLDVQFSEVAGGVRIEARKNKGTKGRSRGGSWKDWFHGDRHDEGDIEFLIEAPERMDLSIASGGGHLKIQPVDGDVTIETGGGHINFDRITGAFKAVSGGGHVEGGSLESGGSVRTGGGHVNVRGADGDLKVETGGGHIEVGDVRGELTVSTGGGHVSADKVEGSLTAKSGGGHVGSKGVGGDASVSTGGGKVELDDVAGFVKVSTGGGHVRVSLAEGNSAGADISTVEGGIVLQVPRSAGFDLDAHARRAEVQVDLPGVNLTGGPISRKRVKAQIGRGGGTLLLRSDGYDIVIEEKGRSSR